MQEQPDEVLATARSRAIQALEKMLATLQRAARVAAGLRETGVARHLHELALEAEHSLQGLRTLAALDRSDGRSRRNGR